jgi:hypothetical protein
VSERQRTPLPPDYIPGQGARELELSGRVPVLTEELGDITARATARTGDESDIAVVLDWAAELRAREGLTWAEALYAASTFYFG